MFVKLWEAEHPLEGISTSLGGYLYTSVKNSCYTYTHKKDILRNTEEFEGVDIPVELVADLTEERIDQVMGAVEELPERTRKVVEAVMIRNLKYREVAEELSISINTVKFLLKDGMRRLRSRFTSVGGIMLFFLSRKLLERRS
jgi:RNA polymerase sigma-70 factor (ECF subfamily)